MLSALSAVEFCPTCSYLALARFRHGALRSFILRAAVLRTRALALSVVDLFLGGSYLADARSRHWVLLRFGLRAAIWLTHVLGT